MCIRDSSNFSGALKTKLQDQVLASVKNRAIEEGDDGPWQLPAWLANVNQVSEKQLWFYRDTSIGDRQIHKAFLHRTTVQFKANLFIACTRVSPPTMRPISSCILVSVFPSTAAVKVPVGPNTGKTVLTAIRAYLPSPQWRILREDVHPADESSPGCFGSVSYTHL